MTDKSEQDERTDHPPVFGMQTAKLHLHQEQEETDGEAGDKEILQVLPETHTPQGSEVNDGSLSGLKKKENGEGE